jgi:hypothetical protein
MCLPLLGRRLLSKKIYTGMPSITFLLDKALYKPEKSGTFPHFQGFSSIEVILQFSLGCGCVVRDKKFLE